MMLESFCPSASSTSSKTVAGSGELLGEAMAHADLLAALAREGERDRHRGFERSHSVMSGTNHEHWSLSR